MRYRLNFKGFYDTPESLFGYSIKEALTNVDFGDIENILAECINNIKNKLGITLNKNSIEDIQFVNLDKYAAQLMVSGQDRYILLINPNKIESEDALVSTIYHELCHVYQLNKLFTERIMFYDYVILDVAAVHEEDTDLLKAHLNDNGGHTIYWQELADKINTAIKPAKKITAYLTESIENIKPELFEADYFRLNFDGFYDTRKTLFGEDS
jgi:hypothetical protein